jgi:hypothetical protein
MNLFKVNFLELYERHLCRHSQFGINVIHLSVVFGIYLSLASIICYLSGSEWLLLCFILPHLALVAFNVPVRVFLANVLFMAFFFALFLFLPKSPVWVYFLLIPLLYKIQAWSHKVYNLERDMMVFNKKYKKGFLLFMLLSVYELPLLLNYLFIDKNNWPGWLRHSQVETPSGQPGATSER